VLDFCRNLSLQEANALVFKKQIFPEISNQWLVDQFFAQKAAKDKISDWSSNHNLIYPDKVAIEQATSGLLARWKTSLIPTDTELLIDGTAGLGVDTFYLSRKALKAIAFEASESRSELLVHNLNSLSVKNVEVISNSFENQSISSLISNPQKTIVYLDPDRRPADGNRQTSWQDSIPNLQFVYDDCKRLKTNLLVKLSPMDNLADLKEKLPGIVNVWVISIQQEVKELLIQWDFTQQVDQNSYRCVEIQKSGQYVEIEVLEIEGSILNLTLPKVGSHLYDPWPTLRKGFMAQSWMAQNGFKILSAEAQLYQHSDCKMNIPSRIFKIESIVDNFSDFSKKWKNKNLNVVSRNFPVNAEEIKKRNKWIDGGDQFLFCYQTVDKQKVYVLTTKQEAPKSSSFWKILPKD